MPVTETATRHRHAVDGISVSFAVPFPFDAAADLQVILSDADGTEADQMLGTDFTVAGGSGAPGTVTMVSAPGAPWTTLTIVRRTALVQPIGFVENDPFPAASHQRALDRLTRMVQELARDRGLSVRLARSTALEHGLELPDPPSEAGIHVLSIDGASRALTWNTLDVSDLAKLDAVAGEMVTLAGIADSLATVAGIAGAVVAVAAVGGALTAVDTVANQIDRVVLVADALPHIVDAMVGSEPPNTAWADYYAAHAPAIDLGDLSQPSPFSNENRPAVRMSLSEGDSIIDLGKL